MATETITQHTDDLDGSDEGVETVRFSLHGGEYEIDLTRANQDKLTAALEPFLDRARKASGDTQRRGGGGRTSGARDGSNRDGADPKAVRAWAKEQDIEVPARGRIPNSVLQQYQAANH